MAFSCALTFVAASSSMRQADATPARRDLGHRQRCPRLCVRAVGRRRAPSGGRAPSLTPRRSGFAFVPPGGRAPSLTPRRSHAVADAAPLVARPSRTISPRPAVRSKSCRAVTRDGPAPALLHSSRPFPPLARCCRCRGDQTCASADGSRRRRGRGDGGEAACPRTARGDDADGARRRSGAASGSRPQTPTATFDATSTQVDVDAALRFL